MPSPGFVYLDLDYKTVEVCTLAQSCISQFGLDSAMARTINSGKDIHTLLAAKLMQKAESQVTREERAKAKVPNFGLPVGMGTATLQRFAKAEFSLHLSQAEAEDLSAAWFELFPEMKEFLSDTTDTRVELARLLDLTATSHFAHTGDDRFLRHAASPEEGNCPNLVLGGMCLKVLKSASPKTNDGVPYSPKVIDFFWARLTEKQSLLPPAAKKAVLARQPSTALQKEVMSLVGNAGVFTYTGRLRAAADSRARHNCVFQGLAADGAKLALWDLWRAGYRIVNFVHDQVLVEVPANSNLKKHADHVRKIMVEAMQRVVPDVAIDVSFAACDRWYAGAKAVFDKSGKQLQLWRPPVDRKKKLPSTCSPRCTSSRITKGK